MSRHLSHFQGRPRGFTLIEAGATLFIFGLISVTFISVFSAGTSLIIESKNRVSAAALANQRLEVVRNLAYDDVGTTSGIPSGTLEETETVDINNRRFTVHTFVQYVDDIFDGRASGTTPLDTVPNDYKRVQVEVTWGSAGPNQSVILSSLFVPDGIEQSAGGGVLSINVLDSTGNGIPQASVHIFNNDVSPAVDVTAETDNTGNLMLPGAPAASQTYEITASKNGYYTVSTYPPPPGSSFNPLESHASVVEATLNQVSLVTEETTDLTLRAEDGFGADVAGVAFHIEGGKQIGSTTGTPAMSVYDLDEDFTGDANGEKSYPDRIAGSYTITLLDTGDYVFMGMSTDGSIKDVATVAGGGAQTVDIRLAPKNMAALLVTVTDTATGDPLEGASVHVTEAVNSYDVTLTTNQYGQAYFPTASPELPAGDYDIEVSASGYTSETDTESVTAGTLSEVSFSLATP